MKLLAKFVLILFPVWAQAQIVIDGVMDDPEWQSIGVANSNDGFGSQNNLGVLKYYSDASTLYIGITGILESNVSVKNNIVLFIDCDNYSGVDHTNTLAGGITSTLGVFLTNPSEVVPPVAV